LSFQLATITAGVLIALSVDRVLELRRQRSLVREAHAAIAQEIQANLRDLEEALPALDQHQRDLAQALRFADDLIRRGKTDVHSLRFALSMASLTRASWQAAERTGALVVEAHGKIVARDVETKYSHRGGRVQARATIGLNWAWIGIALIVPLAVGLIAALPFWWRQSDALIGNVVASGLIVAGTLLFVWREYLDLARVRAWCGEMSVACRIQPHDFQRYAIYGGIGFGEVMAVFVIGLSFEERARRRTRAPEWR
jgi:hypothetical protein